MKRRLIAAVLILGLGLGLHAAFRGLGSELPRLFPHVARETRIAPPPVALLEEEVLPAEEEELQPPSAAIALKRSGEVFTDIDLGPGSDEMESRKLLAPSRLPDFSRAGRAITERFEVPRELVPVVDFWKKVYAVYDSNQVSLHDMVYLEIEYGVLNLSELEKLPESEKKVRREAEIGAATERIRAALTELEEWEGLRPLSEEAQRISMLFRHVHDPQKYKNAKENLRTQTGMKNRFAEAVKRSGRYLPHFEEVFAYYGVPQEITRLAFVESMFRERALSKVAAAGLWQFMSDTGRRYMTVDKNIDERYDPIVATHGAAKLLLRNHDLLGSWPLAINAYNSGPGNLQKAIQKLGTRDIGKICTQYKTGSYSFASRNFYPSFLAALDVYENQEKYFGRIVKDAPWRFDQVQLPSTMSFPEIAFLCGASLEELRNFNPAFSVSVFEGKYSLPAGSQVRLPPGRQSLFASRFIQYSSNQVASILMPPTFHVVEPGESYADIAARYGIPFQDLRRVNAGDEDAENPSKGKVLLVPSVSNLVQN